MYITAVHLIKKIQKKFPWKQDYFLMEQTGLSRQETVTSIEELEAFGLVGFASNGDFRLKEV